MGHKREKKGSAADKLASNKGGQSMSKFYMILAVVAVVGIGAVGYQVTSGTGAAVTEPVDLSAISDDPEEMFKLARPVLKGDPNAPITVLEFADYQCPACGQFAREHAPMIVAGYVDTGKVNFAFYDFPLTQIHPHAFLAARAGRCADDQDGFWEFQDIMFRNQRDWSSQASPSGSFGDYAEEIGLDRGEFRTCLNSDRHADVITANMELARQLRIQGTPTVIINAGDGRATRLPSFDFGTISRALDEALAAQAAGSAPAAEPGDR
jgi:protein-disulfide isomerase